MEIEIHQRLPVSSILFLIYISKIFVQIESYLPQITCLSFMDDLRFLVAGKKQPEKLLLTRKHAMQLLII